jgi:hypothetical protein
VVQPCHVLAAKATDVISTKTCNATAAKSAHVTPAEATDVASTEAAHVTSAKTTHVAPAAHTTTAMSAAATAAGLRVRGKEATGKHCACQNHHHSSSHDILHLRWAEFPPQGPARRWRSSAK